MNRMYRFGALFFSATLLFVTLTGCGTTESTEVDTSSTDTAVEATETTPIEIVIPDTMEGVDTAALTDSILQTTGMAGDTVVATAGDIEITAAELLYQVAYMADSYLYDYSAYGITSVDWESSMSDGTTMADVLMSSALDTAVFYGVIDDIAVAAGVTLSEENLTRLEDLAESMLMSMGSEEMKRLTYLCIPVTDELYKATYQSSMYVSALVEGLFEEGGELDWSDEELLAYAQDTMGMYGAKHILFLTMDSTGAPLSEEEQAEKLVQAQDVLAELEGASDPVALFDTLMNEYSEDGRNTTTGELYSPDGYNATQGQMVTAFEEGALALEVGEISGIVETEYGYHIILRTELTLDDTVSSSIQSALILQVEDEWLADYPVETNEYFDWLDVERFYDNLTELRSILSLEMNAVVGK